MTPPPRIFANTLGREGAVLHSPSLGLLQRLVDLVVIAGIGLLINAISGFGSLLPLFFAIQFAALFVIAGEAHHLYDSWRAHRIEEEIVAILMAAIAALFIAGLMVWPVVWLVPRMQEPLIKHGALGSLVIAVGWSIAVILALLLYRVGLRALLRAVRIAGLNHKAVLLVGSPEQRQLLERRMGAVPWYGLVVVGGEELSVLNRPEGRGELVDRARSGEFEEIYLMGSTDRAAVAALLAELSDLPVSAYLVPDIFFSELTHPRVYSIAGVPAIGITTSPMLGAAGWLKRVEDLVLGVVILALIAVPMLLIALAIRLTSPGPALFRQMRYGLDGRPITVFKFRTMRVCEDGASVVQATRGDQRVTPLGRLLRRTSLDELPQFINVLRGDMSIVGPRPHARTHNEYYRRLIPSYMLRHKIKPGITGWAQVNGWRGETDELYKMERRVEFDLEYVRNWSLWFDMRIIVRTVFHVLFAKDVY